VMFTLSVILPYAKYEFCIPVILSVMKLALPHNVSTDYQKASFGPTSDVFLVQMGQYHNEADRLKATLWTVRFRPASKSE